MEVDYNAHYGIGVKVDESMFEGIDDQYEFLDNKLEGSDYKFFYVGDGAYTGDDDTYYIVIGKEIFDNGYNITDAVKKFELFLKDKEIKYIGKIDIVVDYLLIN